MVYDRAMVRPHEGADPWGPDAGDAEARPLSGRSDGPAMELDAVNQERSTPKGWFGLYRACSSGFPLSVALSLSTPDTLGRLRVNNPESVNDVPGHYTVGFVPVPSFIA